jgi:hypothetical protein
LLLAPAAISAFAGLFLFHGLPFGLGQHHLLILGGFGLGRHLILILGGVCYVTFFLSPLFFLYTLFLVVYFVRSEQRDGVFWAVILLLPQAYACYVLIIWFTHGIALET